MDEYMQAEYAAWQATNRELERMGLSWDDPKMQRLWAYVMLWGETLADIRITQDYEIRKSSRDYAENAVQKMEAKS